MAALLFFCVWSVEILEFFSTQHIHTLNIDLTLLCDLSPIIVIVGTLYTRADLQSSTLQLATSLFGEPFVALIVSSCIGYVPTALIYARVAVVVLVFALFLQLCFLPIQLGVRLITPRRKDTIAGGLNIN